MIQFVVSIINQDSLTNHRRQIHQDRSPTLTMVLRDQAASVTAITDIVWMARMAVTRMETLSISDRAIRMRMNDSRHEREKGKQADLVLRYSPNFVVPIVLSVSGLVISITKLSKVIRKLALISAPCFPPQPRCG